MNRFARVRDLEQPKYAIERLSQLVAEQRDEEPLGGGPRFRARVMTLASQSHAQGRTEMARKVEQTDSLHPIAVHDDVSPVDENAEPPDRLVTNEAVLFGLDATEETFSGTSRAEAPGYRSRSPTVNRLCSSGLEAIAIADQRIRLGGDRVVIAGGVESMSLLPFGGLKPSPNPWMAEHYPASLLTMGLTAERVARHYQVSREDQDAFAFESHKKALAAQADGRFNDELIPVTVSTSTPGTKAGKPNIRETQFATDEGPRADTSLEALARLNPPSTRKAR